MVAHVDSTLPRAMFTPRARDFHVPRSFLVCVLSLWLALGAAQALDPNKRLTQYAHTAWRIQDGIFSGEPTAIAQTTNGYLWIGTPNGLMRFDGVRFSPWVSVDGQPLSQSVYSLLADRDGSLWAGTGGGIVNVKGGALNKFPGAHGRVNSIIQDGRGVVWFTRSRVRDGGGPLCSVAANAVRCYGKAEGIPIPNADPLTEDPLGNLWIGGPTMVIRWAPGSSAAFTIGLLKSNEGLSGAAALAAGANGSLWVGMSRRGSQLGLQQLLNGTWRSFRAGKFDGTSLSISELYVDRHNSLYVGTYDQGIYRIQGDDVDHFGSNDGLSSDSVNAFCEDSEGNMWVATSRGVDSFRDLKVVSFSAREGLAGKAASPVLSSRDGTVWIGNEVALNYVSHGKIGSIRPEQGLPGQRITSLFEDRDSRLWIGTDRGLFTYKQEKFRPIRKPDNSAIELVLSITQDAAGNVWAESFGDRKELIRIEDGRVRAELPAPEVPSASVLAADPEGGGLWLGLLNGDLARYQDGRIQLFQFQGHKPGVITQMIATPDGSVMGATPSGVIGLRRGKTQILDARNGLPCNSIYGLVFDAQNNLWLYTQCGLVELADQDLKSWWENPDARVNVRVLDGFDGVQPSAATFQPAAARTADGRLWFVNDSILQVVDPGHLPRNPTPPPVHVEGVVADRKRYSPDDGLRLPPLTRDLEIDYSALSFVNPAKVRFRYMLEGHDRGWQEPGTRRQAFYTDLRPGNYRFRVIACNNDGVWNEAGATLDFSVVPAWYQANWFRAICVTLFLALLWAAYQLRVRHLHKQFDMTLEARVGERTRIARDLHDTLLQSFHGLLMRFQSVDNLLPERPVEAKQRLESAIDQATEAITEGRDAVQGLRSSTVETNDLAVAIRTIGEELAADETNQSSAVFQVEVEGTPRNLHPILRDEVYRLTGEALRNAFRHAQARRIEVEIRYDQKQFRLRVRDDGKGIDPKVLGGEGREGHYGLHGMRERAKLVGGKVAIWSERDSGTELELSIPASTAYARATRRRFWLSEKFSRKGTAMKS